MSTPKLILLYAAIAALVLPACNVTKHLPDGESLYVGSVVKVATDKTKNDKSLDGELNPLIRPKPNTRILGIPYKLIFYNLAGTSKKNKGLRRLLRTKLGEPPVLASQLNVEKNRVLLENRLQNRGYFHAAMNADTSSKKRKVTGHFTGVGGPQYHIRNVEFPQDSTTPVLKQILRTAKKSVLKPGDAYDLDAVKNERNRIDLSLKNHGFYYYNAEYMIAQVDTGVGKHLVDMKLSLKTAAPKADLQPYKIRNIYIYPTYSIERDSELSHSPAIKYDYFYDIDPDHQFKPKLFSRMLVFRPGTPYSRREHNLSLNRLQNLGTFKFVKARFEEVDTAGNYLDPYYFMTPMPKKSWRLETTGFTKSDNATGGLVTLSWRNRNIFRGAELFTISVSGGLQYQISGDENVITNTLDAEANLYLPRILAPFRLNTKSDFVSRTHFNAAYEFYNRTTQYTLNSIRGSYGFVWKENVRSEHQLNIINVNYVHPINITQQFQDSLNGDITLRRSIEPQFILGPSYNYNYNTLALANNRVNNFYFNFNVDAPGNILGLVTGATFKGEQNADLFGSTPFSQYFKVESELRHYLRLGDLKHKESVLASRLWAGIAVPYGNSTEVPFIKEFFVGGTNDIRAWRARSLGPGSYYVRNDKTVGSIIPDEPGDIKLEGNTELRGKLISIIQGALFIDAGNVWTIHNDTSRPGSQFTNQFYKQIAVGAGAGIRADLSFLVLRIDLAFPIRKPYGPDGPGWVFDKIALGDPDWRKENLVLNLAIGFPF